MVAYETNLVVDAARTAVSGWRVLRVEMTSKWSLYSYI